MTEPRRRGRPPAKRPLDDVWDASKLRAAWDRAGLDPTKVAGDLGTTTQSLRTWRNGWVDPKANTLRALAQMLGVDILDVLP
jgi:hypothetical protein